MREFCFVNGSVELGKKTYIMGILNVTPDSFSDGGKYFSADDALSHALKMCEDGADIIDIGAFSTRPFSQGVSPEEEWNRLNRVLPVLRQKINIPLSVDTFVPQTAEKSLIAGADIINDVSGVFSEEMAAVIKKYGAGWVLMHGGVKTAKTESKVTYHMGIVNHVQQFFDETLCLCKKNGISKNKLCFDPGFGFSKNSEQNIELLRGIKLLDTNGSALMSALSRKRFIEDLSGEADASDRIAGTLAANIYSAYNGADFIRVHDVSLHKRALSAIDILKK